MANSSYCTLPDYTKVDGHCGSANVTAEYK